MIKNTVIFEGKEYISQTEFAHRLEVSTKTVRRYIEKGILHPENINGNSYLNFEKDKKAFQKEQNRVIKSTSKKYRKRIAPEVSLPTLKAEEINLPELEGIVEDEILTKEAGIDNLSKVNWKDYTDSLSYDDEMNIEINPVNGKPLLDYERLKSRLVAERYKMDILEKREPYLEVIQNVISCLMTERVLLQKDYAQIYIEEICKWFKEAYGKEMPEADKKKIKRVIEKEEGYFKQACNNILEEQRKLSKAWNIKQ